MNAAMSGLDQWDSFYVIVGSAAGALIGLQFVVLTLVASRPSRNLGEAGPAYGTPTVVHFSAVLLLAALLRAPWPALVLPAALCGLMGLAGIVYAAVITRRMLRQEAYRAVIEDWAFHAALPLLAYVLLALAPFAAPAHPRETLFGLGAAALFLLFTGIHNAWDATAYHVFINIAKGRTLDGDGPEDGAG